MQEDWKLIHYLESGQDELYHLGKDLGEQNDLAKENPQKAKEMRALLDQWLKQTKATFPTPDPQFDSTKRDARWKHMKTNFKKEWSRKLPATSIITLFRAKTGGSSAK